MVSLPPRPSSVLASSFPVMVSAWLDPVTFSMPIRTSDSTTWDTPGNGEEVSVKLPGRPMTPSAMTYCSPRWTATPSWLV